jgi:[acyl-carrier-protein] S-malonyltransferase
MGTAYVFPGMAPARFADVGRFMVANRQARALLRRADEVLGYRVVDRFADASDDYDEAAQVAFLVNCLALAQWWTDTGQEPARLCVGPSFGQKTVLGHTGVLSIEDTVLLTARIARALAGYFAREHTDVVTQSVVRLPADTLAEILAELTDRGGWSDYACHIDATFFMVNLRAEHLDWFTSRVRAAGGLPFYTMRPPMHSALFTGLRDIVDREALAGFSFADPTVPIVCDQTGRLLTTGAQARAMLLDGLVRPVRWPDAVATLAGQGVTRLAVLGQDAMFGRVDCVTRTFDVVAVNPVRALQPRPTRALAGVGG